MYTFAAKIELIGVNPFVFVPEQVLCEIFAKAERDRGPLAIHGTLNDQLFTQTLVRYSGEWRLYINTSMLKNSPKHVGEIITLHIDFDTRDRNIPLHPKLREAFDIDERAGKVYESLTPSSQLEINRYISRLKSEQKIDENVRRAVDFLNGKGKFVGRDKVS